MYARAGAGPPLIVTLSEERRVPAGIDLVLRNADAADGAAGADDAERGDASTARRPTHSSTECTPRPPVSSRTRSTASSPRSLTTSVAPKSLASAIRSGWRPRMKICSAPSRLAAITPHRPTAPSPTTATSLPGATLAARAAWWPVPITSESVSSDGISASSSSTGRTTSVPSACGTRTASPWPPSTARCRRTGRRAGTRSADLRGRRRTCRPTRGTARRRGRPA